VIEMENQRRTAPLGDLGVRRCPPKRGEFSTNTSSSRNRSVRRFGFAA